jgi:hypothetical protein
MRETLSDNLASHSFGYSFPQPRRNRLKATSSAQELTKPTLCLFTDSLEPSGLGEHMLTLAAELRRSYQILFVCPSSPTGSLLLERAAAMGCIPLACSRAGEAIDYELLNKGLCRLGVQIFHGHAGIGWEGQEGIHTARAAGVPVVVRTEHLPFLITNADQRDAFNTMLSLVDRLICVSAEAQASFIKAGVPAEKLGVVRNGIHAPSVQVDPKEIRQQLGLPASAKIILTVARLTEQKGHRYLLEAIPTLLQQEPDVFFLWVGEGPLEAELRRQIQEQGLDQHVYLAGQRRDVPQLMAASDLFVLPSLFEGLPIVVLEAMAIGVPIVGTRICGTREAITDGVTGRLVEAKDAQALTGAIVAALQQPQVTARWSKAARLRFEREFSAARMAREVLAIYAALAPLSATPHYGTLLKVEHHRR